MIITIWMSNPKYAHAVHPKISIMRVFKVFSSPRFQRLSIIVMNIPESPWRGKLLIIIYSTIFLKVIRLSPINWVTITKWGLREKTWILKAYNAQSSKSTYFKAFYFPSLLIIPVIRKVRAIPGKDMRLDMEFDVSLENPALMS